MRPIHTKLFRDLAGMKGQMTAVCLVMACGLSMMIMARGLIVSLETTRDRYYAAYGFADLFCDLKRAPEALTPRLSEIPGLAAVETRVKGALTLDIPGMREPAEGLVISIPERRPQRLNRLYLKSGVLPEPGSRGKIVVGEAFARAHGLTAGERLTVTIHGGRRRLLVVGIAISPEFVFHMRPGDTVPDDKRYGVFWMNEGELSNALDLDGAFNSVTARLAPGAGAPAVMAAMDRLLEPYGGLLSHDRTEQPSSRQMDDEIRGLRAFAIAFPVVFLTVSAIMTSAALNRLVRLQREQIAQLKAFGYTSWEIGWHYFQFALVAVAIATLAGGAAGLWLGEYVVILYRRFFRFPSLFFHPDWPAMAIAFAASAGASFLGVFGAVRHAVRLHPAEAMRPEPPAPFSPSLIERLGLERFISPAFRMALRHLERKPWQAFFTAVGLSLATAIPIVPCAMEDGINYLMDFQFRQSQRQDATIGLIEPAGFGAWTAMNRLPGVMAAEPFRSVPARLSHGHRYRRVAVMGLERERRFNRLLDTSGRPVPLPFSGLLVSEKLAEVLGLRPGDTVVIAVQEGRRPVLASVIAGTITDFSGMGAYMEIGALRRLMGEARSVSGAHVAVDALRWDAFYEKVKDTPGIGAVVTTRAALESFNEMMAEMMGVVQGIYFGFAVIVAFGVVYNGARIALSERTRDLATLRVLGFTRREVALVLIGELAVLTLISLLPGLWIGDRMAAAIVQSASTETVRMPLVITLRARATAVVIVLVSSAVSFAVVSRRIRKLDLLGVLKARE